MINEYLDANDYEQVPVPVEEEHTYGNVGSSSQAAKGESVYEIAEIQDGRNTRNSHGNLAASVDVTVNVEASSSEARGAQGGAIYENFNYD